jgi:hypothetical protein
VRSMRAPREIASRLRWWIVTSVPRETTAHCGRDVGGD